MDGHSRRRPGFVLHSRRDRQLKVLPESSVSAETLDQVRRLGQAPVDLPTGLQENFVDLDQMDLYLSEVDLGSPQEGLGLGRDSH